MSTPVRASDRDLRALAAIVSQDRPDLPDGEGLPPSLLADLMGQIRCDALCFDGWDTGGRCAGSARNIPPGDVGGVDSEAWIRRSGITTGTASPAVIRPAPATCAASSRSRTSTRPGNGTAPACTAISPDRRDRSTSDAVPARSLPPTAGPGGMCG